MNMNIRPSGFISATLLFLVVWMEVSGMIPAAGTTSEAMQRMAPFIGKWKTVSWYPDRGLRVPGELEYRWVLGKNWVLVIFVGQHPEREYWEAIAMIRFDPVKNCYISHDFFNDGDPIKMTGSWITPRTLRFELEDEKGSYGIDYTVNSDGTIYQENWVIPKNKSKKITLQTTYTRSNVKA
jgi:hypothetical protein